LDKEDKLDEIERLNDSRVEMRGLCTPLSGPSDVRNLSGMLHSNGFKVRVKMWGENSEYISG
jgi:hypothetical protein